VATTGEGALEGGWRLHRRAAEPTRVLATGETSPARSRQLESDHEGKEGDADSMEFDIIGPIWEIETEVHWYEATGVGRKDLKIKRRIT
jgi:hypothetical protein